MPELTAFDRDVRWRVFRAFADTGLAPTAETLAVDLHAARDEVAAALERLQEAHALVLAPGTRHVWMAHPFSAVPTGYGITFNDHRFLANCAWDFFALPGLLGASGDFSAPCAQSGRTLEAVFDRGALVRADGVVHFTVEPRRFWENVAFT